MSRWLTPTACLLLSCLVPWTAAAQAFDPEHSGFKFELRTRWGQRIVGTFPRYEGEALTLADGQRRVRLRLDARAVVVEGSPRYTGFARGERFFDAQRHPIVEFVSEPYPPRLARDGGRLRGRLTIRGVSRDEAFVLAPATCERAGLDCDILGRGNVRRDDYGLDSWRLALGDRVQFDLRVRLRDTAQ